MKMDRPKAPTAVHSPSGLKFLPLLKANMIADCLENQFTPHELCEENHELQVVFVREDASRQTKPQLS
jgi:hypothetical protein